MRESDSGETSGDATPEAYRARAKKPPKKKKGGYGETTVRKSTASMNVPNGMTYEAKVKRGKGSSGEKDANSGGKSIGCIMCGSKDHFWAKCQFPCRRDVDFGNKGKTGKYGSGKGIGKGPNAATRDQGGE